MLFAHRPTHPTIGVVSTFQLIDLLMLRLSRGMELPAAMQSLGGVQFPDSLFNSLDLIQTDTPVSYHQFSDRSHFFVALLEVLRQARSLEPSSLCDVLVILKNKLYVHLLKVVDYGNIDSIFYKNGQSNLLPEDFARDILS
ncbi:hypothetical protein [Cohnella phaseoli]|uniref:Uncharacterized protein n=1 Tax=Cohnella phaseoli TaxID=456490 RepID=A0A3D9JRN9_9BACL|nr:hypothetical protein [Cohnella phaseoli]RED76106.1 hypothetical protein DFP98_113167 [Cohnella phaseoli]